MKRFLKVVLTVGATAFAALGLSAETIELKRNTVVPVKFDQELSIKKSREGDRFTASVDKNRDLPPGTYFLGRIVKIDKKKNRESMQLRFDEVILPDGSRARLDAVPMKWEGKDRYEGKDGKFDARKGDDDGRAVFGGIAIGGLLGSLIKKPFEGAMIGAIAGVIINDSNRSERGNLVVRKDAKMGAFVQESVELTYQEREGQGWYGNRSNDDDIWEAARRDREQDRIREAAPERLPTKDRTDSAEGRLRIGDKVLRFQDQAVPYYDGDVLMVPLVEVGQQLGLDIDRSSRTSRIFISTQDRDLVLEHDSKNYRLNGKSREMDRPVTEKNGVLYVPVKVIGELMEKSVYLGDKKVNS